MVKCCNCSSPDADKGNSERSYCNQCWEKIWGHNQQSFDSWWEAKKRIGKYGE